MTAHTARRLVALLVASTAASLSLVACTGGAPEGERQPPVTVAGGDLRLVAFDSCEQAQTDLRQALSRHVGPYGLGGDQDQGPPPPLPRDGVPIPAAPGDRSEQASADSSAGQTEHSRTNTHEAGVDEPDLAKTDGRRIVSATDGTLRVVDVASRKVTGTLVLSEQPDAAGEAELLLAGDKALVIARQHFFQRVPGTPDKPIPPTGPELILVDLSGAPKVLGRFSIDGRYVDARMVGQTVRVVTQFGPRLNFTTPVGPGDEPNALRTNREVIARSTIDDWLPRYRLQTERGISDGRLDCAAVTHPAKYSAASMLTVLSFDLAARELGTGDPVSIVADGDIVYGTPGSLYVANDHSRAFAVIDNFDAPEPMPVPLPEPVPSPEPPTTELYKFDTSGPGKPRHTGSGAVPGTLLNQYSMSEHDGKLRVATTAGAESAVYVLEPRGDKLAVLGQVGGLGKGERIYAVRFVGPVGYVVTFRETDPLYTLDLRDPASPKVVGELKITGYSAYLHPAGEHRVIGVGQEATEQGRQTGAQVSLFDVSDPARPTRVAQYQLPGARAEAEVDPHAFLYWAKTQTLVLPGMTDSSSGFAGALVLRVADAALDEVGELRHPAGGGATTFGYGGVRRAMVIGEDVWTLSAAGLAANDLGTLADRGWVAFE